MDILKDQLNSIRFKRCEDIQMGDLLHYEIKPKGKKTLIKLILSLFTLSYKFEVEGTPETLCFCPFSESLRKDHYDAFKNVTSIIENKVEMCATKSFFSLFGLKYCLNIFAWNKQLKKVVPDFFKRIFLLEPMFKAFVAFKYFEKNQSKNLWKIKNLLTFCDVLPSDYYFVSKLADKCDNTVTLQHGAYPISSNKWAYQGSESDYFLADSPHSEDCARIAGYKGQVFSVGSMHNFNRAPQEKADSNKQDVFGLVLNSSLLPEEDNITMINVVQQYCLKNNKKLLIRQHPSNNIRAIEQMLDSSNSEVCDKRMPLDEFFNKIDVAIINSSTVFTTALFKGVPAFLFYRQGFDHNLYLNSDAIKFSTEEQLENLVSQIGSLEFCNLMQKYKNYFLSSGNIKENYKNAFIKIGINK